MIRRIQQTEQLVLLSACVQMTLILSAVNLRKTNSIIPMHKWERRAQIIFEKKKIFFPSTETKGDNQRRKIIVGLLNNS